MSHDGLTGQGTAILLAVGVMGVLALTQVEVIREAELPPTGLLVTLLILSAVPVILLCTTASRRALWGVFGAAALLTLFHGLHMVESVLILDWEQAVLILVTMLAPSFLGAKRVWTSLRAGAAPAAADGNQE